MAYLHRRSFLERVALGAGLAVLGPMVTKLEREARGATGRKRFIVYTFSNGWTKAYGTGFGGIVPAEFLKAPGGMLVDNNSYAALPMYAQAFAPLRNKLLIVDGLVNQNGNGGHGCADLLTCASHAEAAGAGYTPATALSFDQYLAGSPLGRSAAFPSLHLGVSTEAKGAKVTNSPISCKGKDQPVPMQLSPTDAFANIFPSGSGNSGAAAAAALKKDLAAKRRLFDYMLDDIKRVKARLAGAEAAKMDQYLTAVTEAENRLALFENSPAAKGMCGAAPTADANNLEAALKAHGDIAVAALTCGMTNVLTISWVGIGMFRDHGLHRIGHGDYPNSGGLHDNFVKAHAENVASIAQRLDKVPEEGGTVLDNSIFAFASDNAEQHHSRGWRYPVMVLGNGGGKLRTEGRYVRYPARGGTNSRTPTGGPAGMRALADLMSTFSHALDVPVNDWGKGGLEKVNGPLTELLRT